MCTNKRIYCIVQTINTILIFFINILLNNDYLPKLLIDKRFSNFIFFYLIRYLIYF